MGKEVVIVGGGLAGLTAACEALEKGCNVTILEKNRNLGGNSSKATCGIAAPGCELQKASGIQDTGADLMAEGPEAKALVTTGTKDVEWLIDQSSVKDELTLRLTPGHGRTARTLGSAEHFPGAVVTYAVIHQLDGIAKAKPDRLKMITGAVVTRILTKGAKVTGAEYQTEAGLATANGEVILATGGFAGDGSANSILAQVAPQFTRLPSTSDERNNGDGIRLGAAVGAATEKMNQVSIYPTAAVLPGQEEEKFKIVLSDTICGAGGIMLNADGLRFVDELASAQVRSDAMMKGKAPFRLVISEQKAEPVKWLCNFYASRNVMKKYASVAALAAEMSCAASSLKDAGSGAVFVAVITPALYACSGGLSIGFDQSNSGKVLSRSGMTIDGLYAAGEACSAPYSGIFTISGIPLLHCIFTGRMAGAAAAKALGASSVVEALSKIATSTAQAPEEKKKKPEEMTQDELVKYVKDLEAGGATAAPGAAAAPVDSGVSLDEIAKHKTKADGWVILFGEVYDVSKWIPIHPGGEKAIEAYLGQDATEEWQMIHKPGTIEKNMQHLKKIGKVGGGGGGAAPVAAGGGGDGISIAEVEKHNKKEDAWIILFGEAIDVTKWIPIHPGGEQAIMAYVGKDATEEWQMIHKPGTVEKNLQHVKKMGKVAGGGAAPPPPAAAGDDEPPAPEGNGGIPGVVGALIFLLINVVKIALKSVLFTGNFKFTLDNNRKGTIRSAVFLVTFTLVHAAGNFSDMLGGPDEANGEGYMFDRIHWTGSLGGWWQNPTASIIEEYLALAILLHVSVALKRSWDISMNYTIGTGRWNMLISGVTTLAFLMKHLSDIRFYPNFEYTMIWAPKYLIAFDGLLQGRVFAEEPGHGIHVRARDIYSREVVLFKDLNNVLFYSVCIMVFVTHLCLGWKKLIPADAMQIPRDHQQMVIYMGWAAALAVGSCYMSVPWYAYFSTPQIVEHVA